MPYITSTERLAREEGRNEGREEGRNEALQAMVDAVSLTLELKFGEEGSEFAREIRQVTSLAKLTAIQRAVRAGKSLDELRDVLK
jgi:predicted transposase YdaD